MPDIHDDGHLLTLSEYATHVGAHPRTVKTWLANEELPGAAKDPFTSEWRIPRDTIRQIKPKAKAVVPTGPTEMMPWGGAGQLIPFPPQHEPLEPAEPTRLDDLAEEATFLKIDEAAYYLGIPKAQILANEELFEVMYIGRRHRAEDERGTPMVPKRAIRRFEGV